MARNFAIHLPPINSANMPMPMPMPMRLPLARLALTTSMVLVTTFALPLPVRAAQPDARAVTEIEHLKQYLAGSGCEFNRNGTWYPAKEAVKHIDRKYEYLRDKGMVGKAEDFIRLAGTGSSMSGKDYLVRCGAAAPVPSAQWLGAELTAFRQKTP